MKVPPVYIWLGIVGFVLIWFWVDYWIFRLIDYWYERREGDVKLIWEDPGPTPRAVYESPNEYRRLHGFEPKAYILDEMTWNWPERTQYESTDSSK